MHQINLQCIVIESMHPPWDHFPLLLNKCTLSICKSHPTKETLKLDTTTSILYLAHIITTLEHSILVVFGENNNSLIFKDRHQHEIKNSCIQKAT